MEEKVSEERMVYLKSLIDVGALHFHERGYVMLRDGVEKVNVDRSGAMTNEKGEYMNVLYRADFQNWAGGKANELELRRYASSHMAKERGSIAP